MFFLREGPCGLVDRPLSAAALSGGDGEGEGPQFAEDKSKDVALTRDYEGRRLKQARGKE